MLSYGIVIRYSSSVVEKRVSSCVFHAEWAGDVKPPVFFKLDPFFSLSLFCSFTQSGAGDGLLRGSLRHQVISKLSGEFTKVCRKVQ